MANYRNILISLNSAAAPLSIGQAIFAADVAAQTAENEVARATEELQREVASLKFRLAQFPNVSEHEVLVRVALGDSRVQDYLRQSKKIQAIKELRSVTACGLKAAKDAVEDYRVERGYLVDTNPWAESHDEDPPF